MKYRSLIQSLLYVKTPKIRNTQTGQTRNTRLDERPYTAFVPKYKRGENGKLYKTIFRSNGIQDKVFNTNSQVWKNSERFTAKKGVFV